MAAFLSLKVKSLAAPECKVETREFCPHEMLEQKSLQVKVKMVSEPTKPVHSQHVT
jgi:hypothetical protein